MCIEQHLYRLFVYYSAVPICQLLYLPKGPSMSQHRIFVCLNNSATPVHGLCMVLQLIAIHMKVA